MRIFIETFIEKMRITQETKKAESLEDQLFRIGLTALAAATALAVLYQCVFRRLIPDFVSRIPCFFTAVLGLYCPGCGGTRALSALLHGHFLKAIWYHPFVPYFAVIYLGFLLTQGLQRLGVKGVRGWKFHDWYLWVGLVILALNFAVKNILRLRFGILM